MFDMETNIGEVVGECPAKPFSYKMPWVRRNIEIVLLIRASPVVEAGLGLGGVRAKKVFPTIKAGLGKRWTLVDWAGPRGRQAQLRARVLGMTSALQCCQQLAATWRCLGSPIGFFLPIQRH
ncbi:unnamed protein product [Prunus armeniaca]